MVDVVLISFLKHIKSKNFFDIKKRILVAVSGGIDSMVLLHLMQQTDYQIAVAHIDHNTRSGKSAEDALFIKKYCSDNNIEFHISDFKDDNEDKGNFHHKAHSFRYKFFQSLDYDYIITAHHKDDHIETLVLNFVNGKANKGIPEINGNIVRPLLIFKKSEIEKYAQLNEVPYVEDSSNKTDDYDRNFLRNKIIPQLQSRFKDIDEKLINHHIRSRADQELLDKLISEKIKIDKSNFPILISKSSIDCDAQLLYHSIKYFGFNRSQATDMVSALDHTGSIFYSGTHTLLVDRQKIIISDKIDTKTEAIYINLSKLPLSLRFIDYTMRFELVTKIEDESDYICYFPISLIDKTLTLRTWKDGDSFCPIGMNGKHKTIKKFFADSKIDRLTKHQIPLLLSGKDIMWVCGYRSDHRFRYEGSESEFLKVTLSP